MDELKKLLSISAPVLGSVIGSINPLAGSIFNMICRLFNLPVSSTPDQVATTIQADPDSAIKLQQLQVEELENLINAQVHVQDSAYQREESIVKTTGKSDWVMKFISISSTIVFFLYILLRPFLHQYYSYDTFHALLIIETSIVAYYFGVFRMATSNQSPSLVKKILLPPPADTGR